MPGLGRIRTGAPAIFIHLAEAVGGLCVPRLCCPGIKLEGLFLVFRDAGSVAIEIGELIARFGISLIRSTAQDRDGSAIVAVKNRLARGGDVRLRGEARRRRECQ